MKVCRLLLCFLKKARLARFAKYLQPDMKKGYDKIVSKKYELQISKEEVISLKSQQHSCERESVVTISCTVYNQENFVEKCIEGFLNQRTTFPVEILIHDDASTDDTLSILKKYKKSYPSLIKLICQSENQFSKGENVNKFNFENAKGEYIALCHGDDYWIDELKLEKQVAVMKELGVSICGHPAKEIDVEGKDLNRLTGLQVDSVSSFSPEELILRNGKMLPFGSIMLTKSAKNDLLNNMPPVMFHTGIQILGALKGGIAVTPEPMLAYRTVVSGSTTEIMLGNQEKKFQTTKKRILSIKHLKSLYGNNYSHSFDTLLSRQALPFLITLRISKFALIVIYALRGQPLTSKISIISNVFTGCLGLLSRHIFNVCSRLRKIDYKSNKSPRI